MEGRIFWSVRPTLRALGSAILPAPNTSGSLSDGPENRTAQAERLGDFRIPQTIRVVGQKGDDCIPNPLQS